MGKTFDTRNIDVVSLHCDWWSQRDCWLHINFIVIRRTMLTSGKRMLYFGKEAPCLLESKKRPLRVATKTQRWNISRRPRRWRSKESWLQFMNKPIPLSQQTDSSLINQGSSQGDNSQSSSPCKGISSQKAPPHAKGRWPKGRGVKKREATTRCISSQKHLQLNFN